MEIKGILRDLAFGTLLVAAKSVFPTWKQPVIR
jgi:hypothetical protein